MSSGQPILVTGATGRQGGAVLRHLLQRRCPVRALTRDETSRKARALATLGAEIFEGDFDDQNSIARAVEGTRAVFGVQDPWLHGIAAEIRQSKMLGDVARRRAPAGYALRYGEGSAPRYRATAKANIRL